MKILTLLQALVQSATPSSPDSSFRGLFAKSDGWYDLDSSGKVSKFALSPPQISQLAGSYISCPYVTAAAAGAVTSGQTTYLPIFIPVARAFDRIAVNVTQAAVGGTAPAMRLGIYADDGTCSKPGALVLDAGTVTITATGIQTATISITLQPGLYWLAAQYTHSVAPGTLLQVNCFSSGNTWGAGFTGNRFLNATGQVAGALPGPAPTVSGQTGATGILVGLRAA